MKKKSLLNTLDRIWFILVAILVFLPPLLMLRGPGHEFIKEVSQDIVTSPHYVPLFTNLLFKEILAQCLIFLLLAVTITQKYLRHDFHLKYSPMDYSIIGLVIIASLSFIYTKTLPFTFESWGLLVAFILLYYLLRDHNWTEKEIRWILGWVIASAILTAFFSTCQHLQCYLGGWLPKADDRNRMSAFIGHNNGVASFMMMASFAIIFLYNQSVKLSGFRKFFYGVLLGWFAFIILATLSRGVWMGTLVGLLVFLPITLKNLSWKEILYRYKNTLFTFLTLVIFMIGILSFPNPLNPLGISIQKRFHDTFLQKRTYFQDDRIRMWTCSWEVIKDHPFTGIGLGGLKYWIPIYQGRFFSRHPDTQLEPTFKLTNHSHNEYLESWAEMGIAGFLLVLVLVGFYLYWGWKKTVPNSKSSKTEMCLFALYCGSLGILIQSLVDFPFHVEPLAVLFILFAALVTRESSVSSLSDKEVARPVIGKEWMVLGLSLGFSVLLMIPLFPKLQADWYKNRMDYFLQAADDFRSANQPVLRKKALAVAMDYGNRCVDLDPRNGRTQFVLGLANMKAGDAQTAITHMELAMQDLQYADLHYNLANVYEWMSKQYNSDGDTKRETFARNQAISHYRMAAFIYPPRLSMAAESRAQNMFYMPSESLHKAGLLLKDAGKESEAITLWGKAAANDTAYLEEKFLGPARDDISNGHSGDAIPVLSEATAAAPANLEAYHYLVVANFVAGNKTMALNLLQDFYQKFPQDPTLNYFYARYYEQLNNKKEALVWANKTADIKPDYPELQEMLKRLQGK